MAYTNHSVQLVDRDSGLTPTMNAANAAGDQFLNSGRELVLVTKSTAGTATLTANSQKTLQGLTVGDRQFTVPASDSILVGPFDPEIFNDGSGYCQFDWSAATDITLAVFRPK